ncbi:MAG: putative membrane-anchored protein, partial [Rheinheimera aquimaris]
MDHHPLKDALVNELHNRPFPVVAMPAQISSLVFLHTGDRQDELNKLAELAHLYGVAVPPENADCYYQSFADFDLRWEFHNEFSTYTVVRQGRAESEFFKDV